MANFLQEFRLGNYGSCIRQNKYLIQDGAEYNYQKIDRNII